MAKTIAVWDRPAHKARNEKASIALTADQLTARDTIAKQITDLLRDNLDTLGGFITPGNPDKDGKPSKSLMVALSLPMPPLKFIAEGGTDEEETRAYTLNINAVLAAAGKGNSDTDRDTDEPIKALSYAELRKRQNELRAKK